MLFDIAMLVAGLVLLVFAGDYLVKGAVGLAENLGIPALIIGLTIVAFGTSAPELFVALQSALTGVPDIATGNVVGSNIANVLLVMGLPALFSPIHANQRGLSRNVAVMLAFTVAFMWLISDGMLSRLEAMGLFGGLIVFIVAQGIRARQAIAEADEEEVPGDYHDEIGEAPHSPAMIAVFLIGGIIGLPVAAHFTVSGASGIATAFGVSEAAIGLTIVAIGTSLPELATTLSAAMRKEADVALGNIIGSNIFNLAAIMGITGMVIAVPVSPDIIIRDNWVMLATSLLLATICFARITTGKVLGAAMLAGYLAYVVVVF
ncbi:MAG: calcium/sodium antiporter [Roseitalea sp.]|jgi:cation:H+ antiporter|uniref:Sodium:calcium antiporter n=1 Tax=Oceaniradius stylonematis TaxID=2184161 RepID=A0A3A8AB64_9HYPH|nr:calcium/sodium antiporter [Oceaniradius stylonematis]MBO6552943.1 calcium/sodium antiporter [Roseitalea sp.]MBO6951297.1 calcium/sodium antiporter [Rhizobiaceae bacterium]RNC93701.1 MAG: calcium/sodium antiporter [Oricola sp.]MBO6590716.1 calcium/sodium antiporter [Roseitalea sp.]MBO6600026.1 calcium/sodium antiporter [Roseitalea sp.]